MNKINLFCFGFGQVAKNFVKLLRSKGSNFELNITSRDKTEDKKFDNINYKNFYLTAKL